MTKPGRKAIELDTDEIISLWRSGRSIVYLANKFGVSQKTIRRRLGLNA